MTEVYERRWYGDMRLDEPDGRAASPVAVALDDEPFYEQWIGLLYACAVFRGVLVHPPAWS